MTITRRNHELLARVNFPPYTVHCLTERHVLVAGGGGRSKTGIRNVIEIYELIRDGKSCKAKSVAHYETGNQAIMNCTVFKEDGTFFLFAGMEGSCQLYKLKFKIETVEDVPNGSSKTENTHSNTTVRSRVPKRKDSSSSNTNNVCQSTPANEGEDNFSVYRNLVLDVSPLKCFQTDFSEDPFQKLARFSSVSKILATAGADGHIRVWKHPKMEKLYEIHAHEDDVDDIDFSPSGDRIVSVSRDGHGKIWNSADGELVSELHYDHPDQSQYTFKGCRYGGVEDGKTNTPIFITLNPRTRRRPPLPVYLSKWNGNTFTMEKIVSAGYEMLSAIAISDDGHFIGLGTQEGSVKIYIAFSLQLVYQAYHIHSIFVTGLEFLSSSEVSRRITGGHEASLVSISVDNHINIHYIPYRATVGVFSIIFMFILVLFLMFIIMDYFNL